MESENTVLETTWHHSNCPSWPNPLCPSPPRPLPRSMGEKAIGVEKIWVGMEHKDSDGHLQGSMDSSPIRRPIHHMK